MSELSVELLPGLSHQPLPAPPPPLSDWPLVSVITINYNQAQTTCALLASLARVSYPRLEVIVVDNASPTEEPAPIAERFPNVRLLRSAQNLGFAGGNNLGIKEAQGKYALFLNNDTEVEPDFLEPLVALLEARPAVGLVSPKLLFYGPERLIQYAGSSAVSPWTGRSFAVGHLERDAGQHDGSYPTEQPHGAAMLVPLAAIRRAGLMPELYFLYYEELDWCEMLKRAGYQCHYVGRSTVYHKESVSVGRGSVLRTYYMHRNRLLFIRRNSAGLRRWCGALFFLLVAAPKQSLQHLLRGETQHLRAIWRGIAWHLRGHDVRQNHFLPRVNVVVGMKE